MVMIFGGGNFLISAEGETSYLSQTPAPAAISEPMFRLSVSAPRTHLRIGETVQLTCATVPKFIDFEMNKKTMGHRYYIGDCPSILLETGANI